MKTILAVGLILLLPALAEAKPEVVGRLAGHRGQGASVARYSPDGTQVLTASTVGEIKLWNLRERKVLHTFSTERLGVSDLVFTRDGKRAFSSGINGTVRLWSLSTGRLEREYSGHSKGVSGIALDPTGLLLASCSYDKTVRIWNVASGECSLVIRTPTLLLGIDWSPDGKRILAAGADKHLRLWDPTKGTLLAALEGHSGVVTAVRFHPDGKRALSASHDKTVKVWDLASAKVLTSLQHPDLVRCFSLGEKGLLLTGDESDAASLWDLKSGKLVTRWIAHEESGVFSVALNEKGDRALTGGVDSPVVKIWALEK